MTVTAARTSVSLFALRGVVAAVLAAADQSARLQEPGCNRCAKSHSMSAGSV